jgi:hypothetical protein
MTFLSRIFQRKPKTVPEGCEHDFTVSYWGHAIHDISDLHICGHSTPVPKNCDVILRRMQSGKVGRFQLLNLERFGDPKDMWSADVKPLGYKEVTIAKPDPPWKTGRLL